MQNLIRITPFIALLAVAACSSVTESNPSRTANEQMLISTAADRAADRLDVALKPGQKIFVDATNFEGTDSKYAIGAIRTSLLKKGASLTDDKKQAEIIVEPRAGALSTNQTSFLVGIPSINIPIPLTSGSLPFPELAIYKKAEQEGVAKFAATSYTAHDGNLVAAQDPQYGFSHNDSYVVLFLISWSDNDAFPNEEEEQAKADAQLHRAPRQGGVVAYPQPASAPQGAPSPAPQIAQ